MDNEHAWKKLKAEKFIAFIEKIAERDKGTGRSICGISALPEEWLEVVRLAKLGVASETPKIELHPKPTHDVAISYGPQKCGDCGKPLHERDGHWCNGEWK